MSNEATEILSEEQELLNNHKKERKELQAKIQVLKKSICKGDKKKKKEITEEILKLESDLNKKHDDEMSRFKLSQISLENTCTEVKSLMIDKNSEIEKEHTNQEESKYVGRTSKAQKRREKRENAERERNQRIIEEEALNIHGKRNLEIQAIDNILMKQGLIIYEIPSDGHCLYNAVIHQLKGLENNASLTFTDLRKQTATYLREHKDTFLPFIDNPDSDEFLSVEQYEKYCSNVAETSSWGGDIELQVLSRILQCPIEVIQASGTPYVIGDDFESSKKLILTYHRHMYQLGAHYNSVTKYIEKSEDS